MTKQQRKERRIEAQEIVNKSMFGGLTFLESKGIASAKTGLSFWYVHRWVRANPENFNPEKY